MVESAMADVLAKVNRIQGLDQEHLSGLFLLSPGFELDTESVMQRYCDDVRQIVSDGSVAPSVLDELKSLSVPGSLIQLCRIVGEMDVDDVYIGGPFSKGELLDETGRVYRLEEHWINVGRLGDDVLLQNLVTEEVAYSDQHFWRYNELNRSRTLAPDILTFVSEYVIGEKYSEIAHASDLQDPEGWYATLVANGWS